VGKEPHELQQVQNKTGVAPPGAKQQQAWRQTEMKNMKNKGKNTEDRGKDPRRGPAIKREKSASNMTRTCGREAFVRKAHMREQKPTA